MQVNAKNETTFFTLHCQFIAIFGTKQDSGNKIGLWYIYGENTDLVVIQTKLYFMNVIYKKISVNSTSSNR